ncbi:helix-turn-helix domain-containing protein [Halorarius halobius]|uniref:helix-turn-helix domain-containing protein n=1 Tax=Halorarius halobius TaxID=2962671 RepID=UPI0020CC86E3|nr:multiprotein-bridging factor 1 family protein [Halorarius halobius]
MAKYSTGGVGSDDADSCELCGTETGSLRETTVAGARLQVCKECARHGERDDGGSGSDSGSSSDGSRDEQDRRKRAAQNVARLDDARKGDPSHWEEEGTDYQDDPLPYLVRGYGEKLQEARQEAGLQPAELAGELGVDEADILAVEQGRANRAGIGGALIEDLEERLNVQLSE